MRSRKTTRISLLLTVSLIIGILSAAFMAVGVSAAPVPKDIEKVIVDMRSEGIMNAGGAYYYQHTPKENEPDPLTGGKYSFDKDVQALKVEYYPVERQNNYRFMFRINKTGRVTADYHFVAIAYKVETSDASFKMMLSNTPGQGEPLYDDGKGTLKNGDWTIFIGDITKVAKSKTILDRWVANNINTLSFEINDPNAKVYVREVGLFKTEQDAKDYYTQIDINKSPKEYMSLVERKAVYLEFTDVQVTDPYYVAVQYAYNNDLFKGTSDTTFSPATPMTRGMYVTVLGRLAKADVEQYKTPTFSDVVAGQWYTSYVEWAAANSVVNGIGEGKFGVDINLTIEQACVMLARYAQNKAAKKPTEVKVEDFKDAASISDWAAEAMAWALTAGVYAGKGENLNPTAEATRADVAQMFYNYIDKVGV